MTTYYYILWFTNSLDPDQVLSRDKAADQGLQYDTLSYLCLFVYGFQTQDLYSAVNLQQSTSQINSQRL